ncbi:replicative DNA helicase [Neoroseomonas lacus]|uniref:DNA 5'-3' helicase n=1 Tax=Neoroseomonas lacus TaxID=287609 RepID=A0A917NT59_9PROT|nr:replicative DNA helicase [Neoroseomonas lacus]GGJ22644.1 replicative DNA helicase [Neoroseomonas lacus]
MSFCLPANPPVVIEAEQAVLGSILANNRNYELVADILRPEHFADPILARIFSDATRCIQSGQLADAITLRGTYEADGALHEVGGPSYLPQLISAMASPLSLQSYAEAIVDRWRRRQIMVQAQEAIARAQYVTSEDPAAAIASAVASEMLSLAETGTQERTTDIGTAADAALKAAEDASRNGGRAPGLPTGISSLDRLIGGLSASQMIVIGARPGVGKTALAISIALAAAQSGVGVLIFSLEMAAAELAERMLANIAGISGTLIRDGRLGQKQWDHLVAARNELHQLDIRIDDAVALTMEQVRLRARTMSRKRPIGLIVIDHIGLLAPPPGMAKAGPAVWTESNSKATKALAKELRIPVLALSQLNRGLEGREEKRPGLADLRWSGSIEQDADVVAFIHRDDIHLSNHAPSRKPDESEAKFAERQSSYAAALAASKGRAELIVAKQRRGPTGTLQLRFDAARCHIADAEGWCQP